MAEVNRSICFTWGQYFPGLEAKGMEAFQEALEYFKLRKDNVELADYRYGIARVGNFGTMCGYLVAEGTKKQINDILEDDSPDGFHARVSHARHCVSNYTMTICDTHQKDSSSGNFSDKHPRKGRATNTRGWLTKPPKGKK